MHGTRQQRCAPGPRSVSQCVLACGYLTVTLFVAEQGLKTLSEVDPP